MPPKILYLYVLVVLETYNYYLFLIISNMSQNDTNKSVHVENDEFLGVEDNSARTSGRGSGRGNRN